MNLGLNPDFSRREILQGGLIAASAAILSGCQTGVRAEDMPSVVWPDKEDAGAAPPVPPAPSRPDTWTPPQAPTGVNVGPPPGVIPRSAWTHERVIESRAYLMGPVRRITVHHEGNTFSGSSEQNAIARRLANIREGHIHRRPEAFADIGYHYVIDPAGRIWEGRPLKWQGAHVEAQNENNLGIMVMGNFDQQKPTAAQYRSLESFVIQQMRRYGVPVQRLYTHKELKATACPGRNLQSWMLAARSPAGSFARV